MLNPAVRGMTDMKSGVKSLPRLERPECLWVAPLEREIGNRADQQQRVHSFSGRRIGFKRHKRRFM